MRRMPARRVAMLTDRRVLLVGIVLVAVTCRAAGAGDRLSADEGYSWLVASAPGPDAFLDRLASFENTPPLFYLLLTPLPLDDEAWLRWPSLVAGVAAVPVLYAAVRALAGTRAALLAALGLAVAPYAVSFSNYSRGFALATLGLALALWACARLATGGGRSWWWLYAAGAVVAVWSEYYAPLFLLPLLGALLALRARPWPEVALLGVAPFLTVLPWLGELDRSLDLDGVTKVAPGYPGPSPGSLRDVVVPLFLGEHGSAGGAGLRTLQFLAIVALLLGAAVMLRRRPGGRPALWLLGGTLAGALVLHAATALAGPDVFQQRYMTALVPLGAALLAAAVDSLPWRAAVPAAAAALLALGAGVVVQRHGRELEPDYARAEAAARGARTVLTNSAVVAYYLDDPEPVLDRPFNLGAGLEPRTAPPYAVVDDGAVGAGARPGPGRLVAKVDGIAVRLVTR
jgi:4-amino-4-deoxy-L-arabinose transferase-like glycosyltransferase